MAEYQFGDVVTLDFPYSNFRSGKKRPAMVIAQDAEGDLIVARITSKPKDLSTDISIRDWQNAGLNVPSYVRLSKLVTIEPSDVLSRPGRLTLEDRKSGYSANRSFAESHFLE